MGSPGIDIAFLQIFTSGTIKNLEGALVLDISATGPLKDLQPHGYVDIRGARFLIKPLNVDVTNATGRVDFDRQQVRVVRLLASAGDRTLSGRGTIELERYSPRRVNLGLSFEKWPAIATHEYRSIIAGAATCTGSLDALQIRGSIESLSGLIRPDISLFQKQSLKRDETINVSRSAAESKHDASDAASRSSSDTTRSSDVAIDLGIRQPAVP
jgi:autotransporter translocation and assembly factor TamB